MKTQSLVLISITSVCACSLSSVIASSFCGQADAAQGQEVQRLEATLASVEEKLLAANEALEKARENANTERQQADQEVQKALTEAQEAFQEELRLINAVRDHYNTAGMWSGIFFIQEVLKIREELTDTDQKILHVRYRYAPIPENSQGRVDVGIDQRTFFLKEDKGGEYQITQMGDANSAVFPDEVTEEAADSPSSPTNSF